VIDANVYDFRALILTPLQLGDFGQIWLPLLEEVQPVTPVVTSYTTWNRTCFNGREVLN